MTTSSVPQSYSITSTDTITIDTSTFANISVASGGINNVTIGTSSSNYYYNTIAGGGYNIGSGLTSSGTISISSLSTDDIKAYSFQLPEEWKDQFPDWNKVQKMCEEYPGLKIAFEKFKTTYKLVKDHYDTPEDQRPRP